MVEAGHWRQTFAPSHDFEETVEKFPPLRAGSVLAAAWLPGPLVWSRGGCVSVVSPVQGAGVGTCGGSVQPPSVLLLSSAVCVLFLDRGEGREEEREGNISVWLPLTRPLLGT